jgi:hypothetical protein
MAPSPPTGREVLILITLLISLVFLSNSDTPSSPLFSHEVLNTSHVVPWQPTTVPETTVVTHAPGWTIFDQLYIFKGVVYIVTDSPSTIPDLSSIYSKGTFILPGRENEPLRLPTKEDIRIINPTQAKQLFGSGIQTIDGNTFLANDPVQFITHYFHWSAELWYGFWRIYSSLDRSITAEGKTNLPPLRRVVFTHLSNQQWQDYAHMNEWVLRSSFPSITMEFIDDWRDRAEMGKAFVYERVVVADRSAAMISESFIRFQRSAASAFTVPASPSWWSPIRNNVVSFAGYDLNAENANATNETYVITYISRQQWGRRMLKPADHEKLVEELYKLRDKYGYEVNVVNLEKMSRVEQLRLAARTTIMMGIHGNGLTSLVWMKPTPRSTVIEFFFPEGFAHDYEYTARAMGMMHFGFWDSKSFTSPRFPLRKYPEGFQGNAIPIDGVAVARLCRDRLTLAIEPDD